MKQVFDEATTKLLTDCKLAVYKHLQSANVDINPEDIIFCGAFRPSARAVLRCGDAMFIAKLADDKTHIEIRQMADDACSIWDSLQ